jgi:farnesyl-diphosphate farnesyltransferase
MAAGKSAMKVLEATSRTFYLPIARLPDGLREAVASGYLCMRAVDEVEDHQGLEGAVKAKILQAISSVLQAQTTVEHFAHADLAALYRTYRDLLPDVTLRLGEWACHAPKFIAPRIWEATASMADRMARWVSNGWRIKTQADLDRYTFGVAGAVGLMLCDLWAWFEQVQINRSHAIQFGRGLQAVNILRNREDDLARGVDFFPEGWGAQDLHAYARRNLDGFNEYAQTLPRNTFLHFVYIPRELAYATLEALAGGQRKLTREAVLAIVRQADQLA